MLTWSILLVFGLPLVYVVIEIFTKKSARNKKLNKVQKRLKDLERRKAREGREQQDEQSGT
jgi:heme exporter protein D